MFVKVYNDVYKIKQCRDYETQYADVKVVVHWFVRSRFLISRLILTCIGNCMNRQSKAERFNVFFFTVKSFVAYLLSNKRRSPYTSTSGA